MKYIILTILLIQIYFVVMIEDTKLWIKGVPRPEGDPE